MDKRSTLLTLHDTPDNRKKDPCMCHLEIMADDINNSTQEFWDELDDFIQWGKTYKLTIEEV